jgi:hypothetical protein
VGGSLNLCGLTSAKGLKLPDHVGGYINLNGLTSAEGLILPAHVGANVQLYGLTHEEREYIRSTRPDIKKLIIP